MLLKQYLTVSLTFSNLGSSSEACLSLANIRFFINTQTGNFHDADLTIGNGLTSDYVLADGREGDLYFGPFPIPKQSSAVPQATVTVTKGRIFGIAKAATDVNEQRATDAPSVAINFPTRAMNAPTKSGTDGSEAAAGGSRVTTDPVIVPGGAGRVKLRLGVDMWIVISMFDVSILGVWCFYSLNSKNVSNIVATERSLKGPRDVRSIGTEFAAFVCVVLPALINSLIYSTMLFFRRCRRSLPVSERGLLAE